MKTRNLIYWTGWIGLMIASAAPIQAANQIVSGAAAETPPIESTGDSSTPVISDDGRHVTFLSMADDLTGDIPDGALDVFRHDRLTGETRLISRTELPPYGRKADVHSFDVSTDGNTVAWISPANFTLSYFPQTMVIPNALIYRADTDETVLIGEQHSSHSGFPGYLTDLSMAGNGGLLFLAMRPLTPPENTNVFAAFEWFDLSAGTLNWIEQPVPTAGDVVVPFKSPLNSGMTSTPDGRHFAFQSQATVFSEPRRMYRDEIMVFDRQAGLLSQITPVPENDTDVTGGSFNPSISDDGRWVLFESRRTNLVVNDVNGDLRDLFLHDREVGVTVLISTNANGASSAGGSSVSGRISGDGQWAAFFSDAPDLPTDDDNGTGDVFLRNNATGEIRRISTHAGWNGTPVRDAIAPAISIDGEFVLYQAPGSGLFLHQRSTGANALITTDVEGETATMSANAEQVAFTARATTFNPTSATPARNIYVWERSSGNIQLITARDPARTRPLPDSGTWLSDGGVNDLGTRYVFLSAAGNLVSDQPEAFEALWVRDIIQQTNILIAVNDANFRASGPRPFGEAVMSGDGRYVAYLAQRTNLPPDGLVLDGWNDVFVHDVETGVKTLVTASRTDSFGGSSNAFHLSISTDGNRVAFASTATNLVPAGAASPGIYMWDRMTDTLKRKNPMDGKPVRVPSISPDGERVAYISDIILPVLQVVGWDDTGATNPLGSDTFPPVEVLEFSWNATGSHLALISKLGSETKVHLHDVANRQTLTAPRVEAGSAYTARADASGRYVAYFDQRFNGFGETHPAIWDTQTGQITKSSLQIWPYETNPSLRRALEISADGRFVVFRAGTPAPSQGCCGLPSFEHGVHLRLWDRITDTVAILDRSIADGGVSQVPPGRFAFASGSSRILFESFTPDAVISDDDLVNDVFLYTIVSEDSDADGMADDWEMAYFDTLDRDGTGDFDGDRVTDLGEYLAGTTPINSSSVLSVTTLYAGANYRTLHWKSISGKRYQVQSKESIDAPSWENRSGVITAATDATYYIDSFPAESTLPPARYYRVVVVE